MCQARAFSKLLWVKISLKIILYKTSDTKVPKSFLHGNRVTNIIYAKLIHSYLLNSDLQRTKCYWFYKLYVWKEGRYMSQFFCLQTIFHFKIILLKSPRHTKISFDGSIQNLFLKYMYNFTKQIPIVSIFYMNSLFHFFQ